MNQLQLTQMEELESIDYQNEEQLIEAKERFKINDLGGLNWAFRMLSALEAKKKEVNKLALEEMERIQAWEDKELRSIKGNYDFFAALVHEYHKKQLEADPKAKTLATPYGKSKTRCSKEAPEKVSEDKVLEHIKAAGMDEYIKESVKWGDFKKGLKIVEVDNKKVVIDENGQVIDGVDIKPESVTYSLEVK
ncbi:host-nuclease inhibitor Gam family protein [Alkalihalobacterium alkalinitrilicum]|uniref:host-nuclease inhibitor Gam family protein n=1 Tax=Alkalihalobacterium alkalinitrilicum TaxID=427920 RepID=UPI000995A6A2|nr:host-nuclease inhibitor Gam family protein [Alkalihalobacterium alkalinitrilicum]